MILLLVEGMNFQEKMNTFIFFCELCCEYQQVHYLYKTICGPWNPRSVEGEFFLDNWV